MFPHYYEIYELWIKHLVLINFPRINDNNLSFIYRFHHTSLLSQVSTVLISHTFSLILWVKLFEYYYHVYLDSSLHESWKSLRKFVYLCLTNVTFYGIVVLQTWMSKPLHGNEMWTGKACEPIISMNIEHLRFISLISFFIFMTQFNEVIEIKSTNRKWECNVALCISRSLSRILWLKLSTTIVIHFSVNYQLPSTKYGIKFNFWCWIQFSPPSKWRQFESLS